MDQQVHRVSVEVGGTQIEFETGKLAKQASGAVLVKAGALCASRYPTLSARACSADRR